MIHSCCYVCCNHTSYLLYPLRQWTKYSFILAHHKLSCLRVRHPPTLTNRDTLWTHYAGSWLRHVPGNGGAGSFPEPSGFLFFHSSNSSFLGQDCPQCPTSSQRKHFFSTVLGGLFSCSLLPFLRWNPYPCLLYTSDAA